MGEVTASVGEPTKVPERPELYIVVFFDEQGYWAIDSLHGVKDYADMKHTTRPGSVLVTIPGSATTPTRPAAEGDGFGTEFEWEVYHKGKKRVVAVCTDRDDAEALAMNYVSRFVEVRPRPARAKGGKR